MSNDGINWRRISKGLYISGFGTLLLLTTLGFLTWAFWFEAVAFWPVLLIGLGVRLIFQRSRTPWAILLSPLIVFSTLAYVASREPSTGSVEWEPVRLERPDNVKKWTLEGDMVLANLDVSSRPLPANVLVEGRAATHGQTRARVIPGREAARVRLGSWHRGRIIVLPGRRQRWDVGVSQELPLTVSLDMAFTRGELDLATVPVSRVDVDGAFNDVTLRLGAPEKDTTLSWEGAFNTVELIVPNETPVRVSKDGFLNLSDGRPRDRNRKGPGYRLYLDGAFNNVEIRSP